MFGYRGNTVNTGHKKKPDDETGPDNNTGTDDETGPDNETGPDLPACLRRGEQLRGRRIFCPSCQNGADASDQVCSRWPKIGRKYMLAHWPKIDKKIFVILLAENWREMHFLIGREYT